MKLAVCDVQIGSLFPCFVQIRMSHFQHYRVCWHSTFVSINHRDYVETIGGSLVLMISMIFLKGLQVPMWFKKNLHPVDVMKSFQTYIWETQEALCHQAQDNAELLRSQRFYPSSLAFYYWNSAPTALYCYSFYTAGLLNYTCIHLCLSTNPSTMVYINFIQQNTAYI